MNEENQNPSTAADKQLLDDNKKNALLRYIAVLFAVAFLFVLLSLLSQMRTSNATISQLSQSSASALQNAEQLQETNRELLLEHDDLRDEIEALQENIEELQEQNEQLQNELLESSSDEDTMVDLQQQLLDAQAEQTKIRNAYEELLLVLELSTPGSQEGNVGSSKALENLQNLKEYLGENALKIYESLLEKGE